MFRYLLLIFFLLVPFFVFSEQKNNSYDDTLVVDHVYTNEDLKKYELNKKLFLKNVPLRNSFVLHPAPLVVVPEVVYNGNVMVELSGCVTLQDSIDRKVQGSGSASVFIPGKGRTEEQICNSVGRGCIACRVLLPSRYR